MPIGKTYLDNTSTLHILIKIGQNWLLELLDIGKPSTFMPNFKQ